MLASSRPVRSLLGIRRVLPLALLVVLPVACGGEEDNGAGQVGAGAAGSSGAGASGAPGKGGASGGAGKGGASGGAGKSGAAGQGGAAAGGAGAGGEGGGEGPAGASGASGASAGVGGVGAGGDGAGAGGAGAGGATGGAGGGDAGAAGASAGSSGGTGCNEGELTCGGACVNPQTDAAHCGTCSTACDQTHGTASCEAGVCVIACAEGFANCDGNAANGCEFEGSCACVPGVEQPCFDGPDDKAGVGICVAGKQVCNAAGTGFGACEGQVLPGDETCLSPGDEDCNGQANEGCVCVPGSVEPCYGGPPGTEGVGACKAGTHVCNADGRGYGACVGEVIPGKENCSPTDDLDCDGTPGNAPDADGDGWTACDGDCCDSEEDGCTKPALVNPGAMEIVGDAFDNDCNGATDEPREVCSSTLQLTGVGPADLVKALDLCRLTTESPPLAQRRWGVIESSYRFGSAPATPSTNIAMQDSQAAVQPNFGTGGILPTRGGTMAGLSTGRMRWPSQDGWVSPIQGTAVHPTDYTTPPSDWFGAHGNLMPQVPSCGGTTCTSDSTIFDPAQLRLRIRVPTNARGIQIDHRFLTADFKDSQCTQYNDGFVILLTSGAQGIPGDHNIVFDGLGNYVTANGPLTVCASDPKNCVVCDGGGALAGTGYDAIGGAGTPWQRSEAPVLGGEIITLELAVWDAGDAIYDASVLLDNVTFVTYTPTVSTYLAP